jgi:hypothetical protein
VTDYDPADRRIVSVKRSPLHWEGQRPLWRFVGERPHDGRLVHRRADAKHFPSEAAARRYTEFLFVDNPAVLAWRIQTLDGVTVDQTTRAEWEDELT